jgi:hypothetical protein
MGSYYPINKRELKVQTNDLLMLLCEESNGLILSDFIAHVVAQFFGVCSLIRFGAACKSHALVVSREVEHREGCIAAVKDKMIRLTMRGLEQQSPSGLPTCQSISMVRKIVHIVERLINV